MIIHTFEQYSDEYWAVKKGKMSASEAQAIASNGKGLNTYIHELMADYYATTPEEKYTNQWMERGLELEDQALVMYGADNGVTPERVGFFELDEELGCSPDALIGEDGLVEIKCLKNSNHFKILLYGLDEVDSKFIWQSQMQLLITGRKWCDLIYYNPNFDRDLIVFRIEPDKEKQEKLKLGIESGRELINKIKKLYK